MNLLKASFWSSIFFMHTYSLNLFEFISYSSWYCTFTWWKYLFSWKLRNVYRYLRNSNLLHSLTLKTTRCWMWNAEKDKQFIFHFPPFFHFSNHECQFFISTFRIQMKSSIFIAFSGAHSLIWWRVENIGFNMPLNPSNLWVDFFSLFCTRLLRANWCFILFFLFFQNNAMRYVNYWESNFQVFFFQH